MAESPSFFVIGCGSIGQRHIANLQALGVKDILAFDVQEERRQETHQKFNVQAVATTEAGWDHNPDVAVIAAPTSLHVPLALEAANQGCHLFIEKPLGAGGAGVRELLTAIKQHGLIALVGCNMRFHFGPSTIKCLLGKGVVGNVTGAVLDAGSYLPGWHPWEDYRRTYSANASMGGGVVLDGIHEIDYARWLLGEIDTVYAQGGKLSSLDIDTEDTVDIIMRTAAGANVSIHMDYIQHPGSRTCKIIGEEGTIIWDIGPGEVRVYTASNDSWQTFAPPTDYSINQMYLDEMSHFLRCLDGMEKPAQDVREAAKVLDIALAAKESMASGLRKVLK